MASKNFTRLCQSVLPSGFAQVREMAPKIQKFLRENLPEAVSQKVSLLTINQEQIVIAADSAMVTNYLRLHKLEIQQQLIETFGLEQPVKFTTLPQSLLTPNIRPMPGKPEKVSKAALDSLTRSAQWIDDDGIKAAMLSLADCLKTRVEQDPKK